MKYKDKLKEKIKDFLYKKKYEVKIVNNHNLLQRNYLKAVADKLGANSISPVLFDVGANQGQTVSKFKTVFPLSAVHSFEPSKICFEVLQKNHLNTEKVILVNKAVGLENGNLQFNEYAWSALNSFLKRAFTQSKIVETTEVEVVSIDSYCETNNITSINILKTDTEGYELNVLKGANRMMDENSIQFVYVEAFFYENFIGQSSFGDIYNYLLEKGFNLVRFYDFEYTNKGYASRTDVLFINEKFKA